MKVPFTICYTSKSDPNLTESDIQEVFQYSSETNNKCGVRGILLHAFGNFFQVLEGDEDYLLNLYEQKIKKDPRHSNIYEVFKRKTVKPVFTNYSSDFKVPQDSEQLEEIMDYLEKNKLSSTTTDKLHRLLKPFIL